MLERPTLQAAVWKAGADPVSRSRFSYRGLSAAPGSRWGRAAPFDDYKPITRKREPSPGPHATFLALKELLEHNRRKFHDAADLFASRYGLLGLIHLDYFPPSLPTGKAYVAPEAVVESDGRLRPVDPTREGLELLKKMVNAQLPPNWPPFTEEQYGAVAMPEEISFVSKDFLRSEEEPVPAPGSTVPWMKAREDYDAVLVLDPLSIPGTGVSVLARKESALSWMLALRDFPSPPYTEERLPSLIASVVEEMRLAGVRDASSAREDGYPTRGWHCKTLLGSLYLMLYLDLMGNVDLKQCALYDCMEYFRPGAQNSIYCRPEHTSLASSRRWLENEA